MNKYRILPLVLALLLLLAADSQARIWSIRPDSSGDAPTIQAAIDSCAEGDVVELACGTYTAVDGIGRDIYLVGERPVCFALKSGVTIRSVSGNPECVTVDAGGMGGVAFISGAGDCVIEGLTLTNGYATTIDGGSGGGLYCSSASLEIRNCNFLRNRSPRYGGAIHVWIGSVTMLGCRIEDNEAAQAGGGGFFSDFELRVEDSQVINNRVADETESFGGGGFSLLGHGPVTIERCRFASNTIAQSGGGGLFLSGTTGAITSTLFEANSAARGGGIQFTNMDDLVIRDCTVRDNEASVWGGGISLEYSYGGYPHLINTDFHDNRAPEAPQGWLGGPSAFMLLECSTIDLALWTLLGYWQIDDGDCAVGVESFTWGGAKATFR